ncbi:hypothetical protein CYLTODRAFT_454445 [Cylindrobasidium torrendii FP15055 ss-10]|uniref:Uncharacterized protein n=1 Tax=Cylindrobasidium torrendii FP15055 ss-10 TaxID=1314674 RepID=A0A0D7BB61_9AGAR|nr:hypothetical protein CYLTODRAFT_454445 [Cylindrobasidium torrendii FP15055 ss-10]
MAQITSEEAVDSPTVQEEELEEEEIQPSPRGMSPLRKAILIFFIGIALAVVYGKYKANAEARANRVVYAKRYSEEFKYRPAASPIITETLKGGGTKLRGAQPLPSPTKTEEPKPRRKRRSKKSKKGGRK